MPGTVRLFRASLAAPPVPRAELADLLDDGERARVERFKFPHLRERQQVATGLLRFALGRLLDLDPRSLRFDVGEFGKPALADGPVFNLSHSGDWWLLGVASGGRLGVDVEAHRTLADLESLARSTFQRDEAAEVTGHADPAERHRAFFRVWSRKEAFIKALGMGLSYPLEGFRVASDARASGGLCAVDDPAESVDRWTLRSVEWDPALSAAVAWDRPDAEVRWCTLEGGPA